MQGCKKPFIVQQALALGEGGKKIIKGVCSPLRLLQMLDGEDVAGHVVVRASNAQPDGFTVTGSSPYTVCCVSKGGGMDIDGSDLALFAADFGRTDCP